MGRLASSRASSARRAGSRPAPAPACGSPTTPSYRARPLCRLTWEPSRICTSRAGAISTSPPPTRGARPARRPCSARAAWRGGTRPAARWAGRRVSAPAGGSGTGRPRRRWSGRACRPRTGCGAAGRRSAGASSQSEALTWQGSGCTAALCALCSHGGGYSYRLCPHPAPGDTLTEDCFNQQPLRFSGDRQWVQYGEAGERVEFIANRTTTGTFPPGSQWTKAADTDIISDWNFNICGHRC